MENGVRLIIRLVKIIGGSQRLFDHLKSVRIAIVVSNVGLELLVVGQLRVKLSIEVGQTLFVKVLQLNLRISQSWRASILSLTRIQDR